MQIPAVTRKANEIVEEASDEGLKTNSTSYKHCHCRHFFSICSIFRDSNAELTPRGEGGRREGEGGGGRESLHKIEQIRHLKQRCLDILVTPHPFSPSSLFIYFK